MKFKLNSILILIFSMTFSMTNINCQTVEELEWVLRSYTAKDSQINKKDKALQLLSIDKFNNIAINYLVNSYYQNGQKDSIKNLLEKLIIENPNNVEPYLIKVSFYKYLGLTYSERINLLKKARIIDSLNTNVNYQLGKLYYELFNREYIKNGKIANMNYYAKKSIYYLDYLCTIDTNYKPKLKFPLMQLSNFLSNKSAIEKYKNYTIKGLYFPPETFTELPNNWMTDYSINVINKIERETFSNDIFKIYLDIFQEQTLYQQLSYKIYRFTYLRTFDNPILIGLVNNNDSITIYWKVTDGQGGYDFGQLVINENKQLSLIQWNDFEKIISENNFWNLSSENNEIMGFDGSEWIIEGNDMKRYHIVKRWCGYGIKKIGMYLINLTDLEIDPKDIY
ncbi:MAG: hypothetical protein PWP68_1147 [Rikenellaceae bacterium]|jgi:hypothetical protein|nr:hypothetical protein [Rikenellaceae bacterium]